MRGNFEPMMMYIDLQTYCMSTDGSTEDKSDMTLYDKKRLA